MYWYMGVCVVLFVYRYVGVFGVVFVYRYMSVFGVVFVHRCMSVCGGCFFYRCVYGWGCLCIGVGVYESECGVGSYSVRQNIVDMQDLSVGD